jgi:hypothetical protein
MRRNATEVAIRTAVREGSRLVPSFRPTDRTCIVLSQKVGWPFRGQRFVLQASPAAFNCRPLETDDETLDEPRIETLKCTGVWMVAHWMEMECWI